jgi:hypothetical protein
MVCWPFDQKIIAHDYNDRRLFLFSSTEPRDLDAIADRCGIAVAEKVSRLPLHGFIVWDVIARKELAEGDIDVLAVDPNVMPGGQIVGR